ncbi:calcium-binding protein [Nannocystaceae bacterium ST9]
MQRTSPRILLCTLFCVASCDAGEIEYPIDEPYSSPAAALPAPPEPPEEDCTPGETRECSEGEGTQFCDELESGVGWGACLVDFECLPGDTELCPLGEVNTCTLIEGVPGWPECPWTPLVLSFDPGAPIETSTSFAAFDIAGTGECPSTDWPSAATPWLAVDLDRNGLVDGGHELFGSGTILDSGRHARNGFVALAPFDGDHDGRVTPADPRFAELLVWRDEDADKRSQPSELTALSDEGVLSIALDHAVIEQCDERGNCGRERARFEYVGASGRAALGEVVDVYLVCQ